VVVGCVALAGCSGEVSFSVGGKSPESAAEERIESEEFVQQIGLGELTAECNDPGDVEEGDTFLCTATTADDQTIKITTTIVDEESLNVRSTNIVVADAVGRLEAAAVDLLNRQQKISLPPGSIECGDTTVVLADDKTMPCVLNDTNGDVYDAVVTIGDLTAGTFEIEVAGQPRT